MPVHGPQRLVGRTHGPSRHRALLEHAPGLADVPLVSVGLEPDQLPVVECGDVGDRRPRRLAVGDLEDPPRRAMDAVVLVALADVAPVGEVHPAVRSGDQVEGPKPGVGGLEQVGRVAADITGAAALEPVIVEPAAVVS